ncbi:MAG: DUF503 domain-containing protein [Gemmatimonadetes bacterium]|nr:DUF503 domain-containing protein [candidate division Zixibacteria bacterium]MDE2727139.1 DUF503 domain-containing protein [Gemmatimonadota bacterium]MDE2848175.1 DUF503 domain-containing protein [Gemmatimonadota bacterium]MXX04987.1 DUF503 domain-containing protein [Gemmatimonadota bacterium]MXY50464.1 DUF503 domain-containing protein [Gemmatimonadota bacterium]
MIVGLCRIDLFLPESRSLKAKRQVIKGLKDRIRNRFNVSVAEVEHQSLWQRATLGLAMVSEEKGYVDRTLRQVLNLVQAEPRLLVLDHAFEWY